MFKKLLIGALSTVVIGAVGASAYNTAVPQTATTAAQNTAQVEYRAEQGSGQGQEVVQGQGAQGANGYHGGQEDWAPDNTDTGAPNPQASVGELLTMQGIVAQLDATTLVIDTPDGPLSIQLGNSYYVESLGLDPEIGESVTVTGFWETADQFTAQQITLDASGETFLLRESTGRPAWAGGNGKGKGR